MTNIDFHIHLMVYSPCSRFDSSELRTMMNDRGLKIVGITDHETINGAQSLKKDVKFTVLTGMEITTSYGDFLVFSTDMKYLRSLGFDEREEGKIILPRKLENINNDENTAIIWAHPHIRDDKDELFREEIDFVMNKVDAVELFNAGIMTAMYIDSEEGKKYLRQIKEMAERYNKPCTGSSDSHIGNNFMMAYTEFEDDIQSQKDFVKALKSGRFKPAVCEDLKWLIPKEWKW